jgi:hypothetical protein
MRAARFDTLTLALAARRSRRVVTGVLGTLALRAALDASLLVAETAAKSKKKHKKKHQTSPPLPSPPPPPPVDCPLACPVCQSCNAGTGVCEAKPANNGQAGQECHAPKVCCGGECCDPIHACNAAGACATCADVCAANCSYCFTLAGGGTACGDAGFCTTGDTCASNADCTGGRVCATSFTQRSNNVTSQTCGASVGTGICLQFVACT